ncbi:uncharacterized protein J3R85_001565 [Psidium guajava]|nr:uncharacterized protein J3R85_001565 [Psidium guajava]
MRSSSRYSLHLERSTSVGDIGSSFNPGLGTDDDYIPTVTEKKSQPQPPSVTPSQTTKMESKDSKPTERSNAARPSQHPSGPSHNSGNLLKRAAPRMAELLSHGSAANSVSKDEEERSTQPRPRVIEGIFFIRSPEREVLAAKKIDEDDEVGLFGEFIKKCTLCKKEFKMNKDVYMYNDSPFCSSDCREDRIALDGFSKEEFGLGKEDKKTMKSLRKDLNQLQMYM